MGHGEGSCSRSAVLKMADVTIPDDMEFYCTSQHQNFLSTTLASSQFILNGTLDVVIPESIYIEDCNTAAGVRMGLELKKVVSANDYMQAIAKLVTQVLPPNIQLS